MITQETLFLGFIYDKPTIALDGNVKRVFARYLNKEEDKIDFEKLIKTKKIFSTLTVILILLKHLMEFGALICKPKDPKCHACCLNKSCKYFKSNNKIKTKRKMIKINEL